MLVVAALTTVIGALVLVIGYGQSSAQTAAPVLDWRHAVQDPVRYSRA